MSDGETDALAEFVQEVVREHYEAHSRPLWLAALGSRISANPELDLPGGTRLSQFIEASLSETVWLIRDPRDPKIIAVADKAHEASVSEQVNSRDKALTAGHAPHSLRVAFCRQLSPGERISYRTQRPFKYHVGTGAPDSTFVEIGDQYRLPGHTVTKGIALPDETEQKLQSNIQRWMDDNDIQLDTFRSRTDRHHRPGASPLQRLLEAQPTDLRSQIVIPGDIALLLLKST